MRIAVFVILYLIVGSWLGFCLMTFFEQKMKNEWHFLKWNSYSLPYAQRWYESWQPFFSFLGTLLLWPLCLMAFILWRVLKLHRVLIWIGRTFYNSATWVTREFINPRENV